MSDKPVIIPVSAELTDINVSKQAVAEVVKTVTTQLKDVKKAMADVFTKIDTSKINKEIQSSATTVEYAVKRTGIALENLQQEVYEAGKSSEAYQSQYRSLSETLQEYEQLLGQAQAAGAKDSPALEVFRKGIEEYTQKLAKLNPLEFLDSASDASINKLENSLERVSDLVMKVISKNQEFNQTIQENKFSEEFSRSLKEAEKLKAELVALNEKTKKMEEIGASDRYWKQVNFETQAVSDKLKTVLNSMRKMNKEGATMRFGEQSKEDLKEVTSMIRSIEGTRRNIAGAGGNFPGTVQKRVEAGTSPYSTEYENEKRTLEAYTKEVDRLAAKYEKMKALGKLTPEGTQEAIYDANLLRQAIEETRSKMEGMVQSGTAITSSLRGPKDEMSALNQSAEELGNKLGEIPTKVRTFRDYFSDFTNRVSDAHPRMGKLLSITGTVGNVLSRVVTEGSKIGSVVASGIKKAADGAASLGKKLGEIGSKIKGIISGVMKAVSNIKLFGKSGSASSDQLSKGFKKLSKNFLMFGLGFRSVYYGVKKLRSIISTAFKAMAGQVDEVNEPLSRISESFNRLKGSMATMLQPLLTVVLPVIHYIVDALSEAAEAIAKFFAVLTGQNYIYKAVSGQEDFADSLNNSRKAADELQKKLGSYDKLDVIQQDKDKDTAGPLNVTFEKAEAEGAASNFAKMIKDAWANQDFTAIGQVLVDKISGLFNKVQTDILPKIVEFTSKLASSLVTLLRSIDLSGIGSTLGTALSSLFNEDTFKNIGESFMRVRMMFWDFASGLVTSIDWGSLGDALGGAIVGMVDGLKIDSVITTISGLINGISTTIFRLLQEINWAKMGTMVANSIMNLFSRIDFAQAGQTIGAVVNSLMQMLVSIVTNLDWKKLALAVVAGLKNMFGSIDKQTVIDGISGLFSGVSTMIVTMITAIDWEQVWADLTEGIKSIITNIGKTFKESDNPVLQMFGGTIEGLGEIAGKVMEIIGVLAGALGNILVMLMPLIETIMDLVFDLLDMIMPMLQPILDALMPALEKIMDTLLPIISKLFKKLTPIIQKIMDAFMELLIPILDLIDPLMELVEAILEPILEMLDPIIDIVLWLIDIIVMLTKPILALLKPLIQLVTAIMKPIMAFLQMLLSALKPIIGVIQFLVNLLVTGLVVAIDVVISIFSVIIKIVNVVMDVFAAMYKSVQKSIDSLWGGMKKVLNAILGGIESLVNGILGMLNTMIRALNKLSFDIPDWVPVLGGKKFGFDIPEIPKVKIPKLAQGAVLPPNKEFLAILGDQKSGTNIEAPLDTIKQALAEVLAEIGDRGCNTAPIVLQLDGRTIAKVVWSEEEKKYKQTGRTTAFA